MPLRLAKVLKDSFFSPASALHTMDKDRNGHAAARPFKTLYETLRLASFCLFTC